MPTLLTLQPTPLEFSGLLDSSRDEVVDRLAILRIQEETTYRVKDYISESKERRKRASKPVDNDCRLKMAEWCFQVVDFCKFRRETVAIGLSYLDRYLCTPKGRAALCNRKDYQLAAMTALYVAIKLHEPLEMETSLLADLSRGCYGEMEFVQMECTMLQTIHWRVNGPTCLGFVAHFLGLLPSAVPEIVAEALLEYARFQTELAVADQSLVFLRPSEIALAAVLNAVEGMDVSLFPVKLQAKFFRYIERYSEMQVSSVEKCQAKLSLLLASVLASELDELDTQLIKDYEEKEARHAEKEKERASRSNSSSSKDKNMDNNGNNNKMTNKPSHSSKNYNSPVSVIQGTPTPGTTAT